MRRSIASVESHSYLVFALALAVAVATPGPGILAVASCAIGRGFRAAFGFTMGIVAGDVIFFLLSVFGLAALAAAMGEFFLLVKILGGAYLVWLGIKLWRTQPQVAELRDRPEAERGFLRNALAGAAVTLSNPKAIGFYAGLLPTIVDIGRLRAVDIAIMTGIVMVVVALIPLAYAAAAARARGFLASERRLRAVNRTAGTTMIGVGVSVAAGGQ